uniref:Uncharacterized protein n=1 Tax=Glossina palpalis gambiensis TaxID=67801 RepID=A0A1B0BBT4_9MUSC
MIVMQADSQAVGHYGICTSTYNLTMQSVEVKSKNRPEVTLIFVLVFSIFLNNIQLDVNLNMI